MKRIPQELDLSPVLNQPITQICVGQYDIQFTIGTVHFAIWSTIKLLREGEEIGGWEENTWPSSAFIELLNVNVASYSTPKQEYIRIVLENEVEMQFGESPEQFESMCVSIEGGDGPWFL